MRALELSFVRRAILAFALAALGCASSSPPNQSFVEVRTPHFFVTSSLGDAATRALARDLEVFHRGARYALGLPTEARPLALTRVVAFDGRGVDRPFAIRGAAASLVPTLEGPVVMIRAAGTFAERVAPDLRHRYAHWLLRASSSRPPPLWYEEGRAQVAGTVEVRGRVAIVGTTPVDLGRLVLDWRQSDLLRVTHRRDLSGESEAERRTFDARSWAIVHTILFEGPRKRPGREALDRVREAFEQDRPAVLVRAVDALGDPTSLTERIHRHLESKRHRVDRLQTAAPSLERVETRALSSAEARDRLGRLALDLGRPALALELFDRILEGGPDALLAQAGRARALAELGRGEEARLALAGVDDVGAAEAQIATRVGLAWLALAASPVDGLARAEKDAARRAFRSVLDREPDHVVALVGLARARLGEGGDSEAARAWLEQARAVHPGVLEIDLWIAQQEIEAERFSAARRRLGDVLSRTHTRSLERRARRLLETADEGG